MKLQELFSFAVGMAMKADPRSKADMDRVFKDRKKMYDKMGSEEKKYFDLASLKNPYYDSRIIHEADPKRDIKTIMVGIDMEELDLMLATELNRRGEKIDLVLAHHPEANALLGLGGDMPLQNSVVGDYGVPINVAEKILQPRKNEIDRGVHPVNFIRPIHYAELLGLNYACTHTVTDNLVYQYLKKKASQNFYTVGDVVDMLMKEPEYQMATRLSCPPLVVCGSRDSRAGRVAPTEITGGTSANEEIYEKLAAAGVGTLIAMHMSEKNRKEAEKHRLNVIVAGHMASDSLGVNLLLDAFEKSCGVKKIIPCGMFRVKRK